MDNVKLSENKLKNKKMNNYILKEIIETGTTSHVYKGIDSRNNKPVAIKVINRRKYVGIEKKQLREERILREVLISFLLTHPNVVKLREFFFTDEYFYLVFDYIRGEQLLKKIVRNKKLSESNAKHYFLQILSAIYYCHSHNLVHRDIKIENILVDSNDNAMLIDFGLSNFYEKEGFLGTFCGSLYFAAPELLSGNLYEGPEIDIWSLGVVLYVMVCGKVPFDDKNMQSLYQKIIAGNISTEFLPRDLESLLVRMLDPNRKTRITLEEIYKHSWLYGNAIPEINKKKYVLDSNTISYINHLFGDQFKNQTNTPSDALISISRLLKDKPQGRWYPNRIDAIVDFVSDRKLKVKKTLIKHWKGVKTKEDAIIKSLEEVLRELNLIFEVSSGVYKCLNDTLAFNLQVSMNRFSKAYGVEISSTYKCNRLKQIELLIKTKLRNMSNPNNITFLNNITK
ncbi:serine/threonine protein kinase KIN1/2 [Nematocida sp. AWRm80]|nr:serine/threonine protein kinase KIN1/2 [Nematocida sp. AWRm80]